MYEIGILRAMGLKQREMRSMLMSEADHYYDIFRIFRDGNWDRYRLFIKQCYGRNY